MASIWEKAISILAGNLNSGCSYSITAVPSTWNHKVYTYSMCLFSFPNHLVHIFFFLGPAYPATVLNIVMINNMARHNQIDAKYSDQFQPNFSNLVSFIKGLCLPTGCEAKLWICLLQGNVLPATELKCQQKLHCTIF